MTSVFAMGQATGQAFGILFGGLALDWLTGVVANEPVALGGLTPWRALYLVASAISAMLLIFLASLSETNPAGTGTYSLSFKAAVLALSAHKRFLAPLLIAMMFTTIVFQAANVWSAPLLIRNHGLSPGAFAGWLSAIVLGTGIVGSLAGGQLAELRRQSAGRPGVLVPALVAACLSAPSPFMPLLPVWERSRCCCSRAVIQCDHRHCRRRRSSLLGYSQRDSGIGDWRKRACDQECSAALAPTLIGFVSNALGGDTHLRCRDYSSERASRHLRGVVLLHSNAGRCSRRDRPGPPNSTASTMALMERSCGCGLIFSPWCSAPSFGFSWASGISPSSVGGQSACVPKRASLRYSTRCRHRFGFGRCELRVFAFVGCPGAGESFFVL